MKKKPNSLGKKYPQFIYQNYSYKISKNNLEIFFKFKIEPDIYFSPKLVIRNIEKSKISFIKKERLIKIFGKNLFEKKELSPIMLELIGEKKFKPFECVGTKKETLIAFYLCLKLTENSSPLVYGERFSVQVQELPFLLEYFQKRILPKYPNIEQETKKMMNSWNNQHNLPKEFEKILKFMLSYNYMLEDFRTKEILILGLGREGMDTLEFLRKLFPQKQIGLADRLKINELNPEIKKKIKSDKKVRLYLGKNYLKSLKNYDIIIKTPGIPFKKLLKSDFNSKKIASQTEIFFENCPGKIIGITGTKGKSTVSSLIYKVLKNSGMKAHLIGNIGKPALSSLLRAKKNDVFVYELSSHQLVKLKKSPHIAIFLNILPDHLDYYQNFKEYLKAKENITRYQTKNDYLIFNSDDKILRKIASKSKAKKIPFGFKKGLKIIKENKIPLKERFNVLNIIPAIIIGKLFNIPSLKIAKAIKNFKPLEHRLEFVGKYRGIKFYDDSAATIPEATISAIEILGKNIQTIILGGSDKKLRFEELAKIILESKIKTVILFPTTGLKIWKAILLQAKNRPNFQRKLRQTQHFFVDNMEEVVHLAYQNTEKEKICLLSCASASFGIFKDYKERGNLFKKYVRKFSVNKK